MSLYNSIIFHACGKSEILKLIPIKGIQISSPIWWAQYWKEYIWFLKKWTTKNILFCIVIVIISSRYVVPLIRDLIDVFGHVKSWGKTFFVSRVSKTQKSIIKM